MIYDATVSFCDRFIDQRSRTCDQMVQAARSGRQNIAEGSRASAASSQTELRLVNVARASLDELLLDYEDFLRQRRMPLWDRDARQARLVRDLARRAKLAEPRQAEPTAEADDFGVYSGWLDNQDPAIVANTLICLIHQANYLLDKQIAALERSFVQDGGYTERLAAARLAERERIRDPQNPAGCENRALPDCPLCGKPMVLRTARKGNTPGALFWGCAAYPACKGTLRAEKPIHRTDQSDPTDPSDFRRK
jgi:four helix bundle suffix protein